MFGAAWSRDLLWRLAQNGRMVVQSWRVSHSAARAKPVSPEIPLTGVPLRVATVVEQELRDTSSNKPTWSLAPADLKLDVWRRRYWKEDPEEFAYRSSC